MPLLAVGSAARGHGPSFRRLGAAAHQGHDRADARGHRRRRGGLPLCRAQATRLLPGRRPRRRHSRRAIRYRVRASDPERRRSARDNGARVGAADARAGWRSRRVLSDQAEPRHVPGGAAGFADQTARRLEIENHRSALLRSRRRPRPESKFARHRHHARPIHRAVHRCWAGRFRSPGEQAGGRAGDLGRHAGSGREHRPCAADGEHSRCRTVLAA